MNISIGATIGATIAAITITVGCQNLTQKEPDDFEIVDCRSLSKEDCSSEPSCVQASGFPLAELCKESPDDRSSVYFGCFPRPKDGECEGDGEVCLTTDIGDVYLTYSCTYGLPLCIDNPTCDEAA